MLSMEDLFKGRHFDREIIILCVRLYLRFKRSFGDLVEMMAERGMSLAHTTIIAGVELMHRIRKGQFKLGKRLVKGKTAPGVWNAVLAA